jgi:hypothetical protein
VTIKCTSIFHSKALQNLPKLGFLVWKQTIWQPWIHGTSVRSLFTWHGVFPWQVIAGCTVSYLQHSATQLGLILTLVAWCCTTLSKIICLVNRPSAWMINAGWAYYLI